MTLGSQFSAMVAKNFKTRFRGWSGILCEIAIPTMVLGITYLMQLNIDTEKPHDKYFMPLDVARYGPPLEVPIVYTPTCTALTKMFTKGSNPYRVPNAMGFKSVEDGYAFLNLTNNGRRLVVFEEESCSSDNVPKNLKFKVVVNFKIDKEQIYGDTMIYSRYGIPSLNYYITSVFINYWQGELSLKQTSFRLNTTAMPVPDRNIVPLRHTVVAFVCDSMFFLFLTMASYAGKNIVEERELKLKETMSLMGMCKSIYWLSWFFMNFLWASVLIVAAIIICCVNVSGTGRLFLANPLLLIALMVVLVLDMLTFCLAISCIIKKTRHAVPFLFILNTLFKYNSGAAVPASKTTVMQYVMGSFVYSFGYVAVVNKIQDNEKRDLVSNFGNIRDKTTAEVSIADGLVFMLINTAFNLLLTWYLDEVYKGDFGVARPFYFLFTTAYWFPNRRSGKDLPNLPPQDPRYFESAVKGVTPGIQVRDLVKMFGNNTAVAGVNIDIYNDQITVLLGHNGAGKTTFISIITGFIPPTSGTAIVNGFDINANISKVRENIGLCPQHDVLFPKLTAYEHLVFYCKLRGQYKAGVDKHLLDALDQVGLSTKRTSFPHQLSGGQRRKLSVACAFSGNSKVIFLDEPSTGLDPSARQDLWKFLKSKRTGHTILMTTHYMDEADAIGDRIAIMAKGVVQCYGTSWFLKNVYGTGYKLSLVKTKETSSDNVTTAILEISPSAQYLGETLAEIEYRVPDDKVTGMPKLLRYVEDHKHELKVISYGLKSTTLEDVFIRVGKDVEKDEFKRNSRMSRESKPKSGDKETVVSGNSSTDKDEDDTKEKEEEKVETASTDFNEMVSYTKNDGLVLFRQQLSAIITKKLILFKRSWMTSLVLLILPGLAVGLFAFIDYKSSQESQRETMYFTLQGFPEMIALVSVEPTAPDTLIGAWTRQFPAPHQIQVFPYSQVIFLFRPGFFVLKFAKSDRSEDFDNKVYFAAQIMNDTSIGFFKNKIVHGEGIIVQLLLNTHVQAELGSDYSVQTGLYYIASLDLKPVAGGGLFFMLTLVYAAVPAVFMHRIIAERVSGAKHLQLLSGVNPMAYWFGNFFFDFIIFLIIDVSSLITVTVVYPDVYISEGRWLVTLTTVLLYSFTILPYIYCVQWIFKSPSNGVGFIIVINITLGFIIAPLMIILKAFVKDIYYADSITAILFPNFALYGNIIQILAIASKGVKTDGYFESEPNDQFRIDYHLFFLLAMSGSTWFLLLCLEFGFLQLLWYTVIWPCACLKCIFVKRVKLDDGQMLRMDSDVTKESERINRTPLKDLWKTDAIVMANLTKVYVYGPCMTLTAVKAASLGIPPKECFGMLGQNGAGKSTIFKMLTGDTLISCGDIYVESKNIKWYLKSIQSRMGYCPQYDALHDLLTGQETLFLYGRLRGVPEKELPVVTARVVTFVNLHPYEGQKTHTYSGGTKRKLSIGISVIGDPAFIMLDEPTAGMDPISRRTVWDVLHLIRKSGRTLILTSHSMEECDALCTRIAIMVQGKIMCLGSPQYLKNKYGQGFTVILYAKHDEEGKTIKWDETIEFIKKTFAGSEVFNQMDTYVHLQVPQKGRSLADIFEILQEAQGKFGFSRYTVQQTSLEQVFLMFMKISEV